MAETKPPILSEREFASLPESEQRLEMYKAFVNHVADDKEAQTAIGASLGRIEFRIDGDKYTKGIMQRLKEQGIFYNIYKASAIFFAGATIALAAYEALKH